MRDDYHFTYADHAEAKARNARVCAVLDIDPEQTTELLVEIDPNSGLAEATWQGRRVLTTAEVHALLDNLGRETA